MRVLLWTLGALLAFALSGCLHPALQPDQSAAVSPRLVKSADPEGDALRMLEDGYERLGISYFASGSPDADVLKVAKAVGADVAVVYESGNGDHIARVASFWSKLPPPVLGVHMEDLTARVREASGAATGALVIAVVKDSPAARAGIVRGDIVTKIGDVEVNSAAALYDAVKKFIGQKVTVELWRQHQSLRLEVQLVLSRLRAR